MIVKLNEKKNNIKETHFLGLTSLLFATVLSSQLLRFVLQQILILNLRQFLLVFLNIADFLVFMLQLLALQYSLFDFVLSFQYLFFADQIDDFINLFLAQFYVFLADCFDDLQEKLG